MEQGLLHTVLYASRCLSSPEKNYSISELETLAVVWAIQHYRAYLYGHEVTVVAILEIPSPSGKHAKANSLSWNPVLQTEVEEDKDVQVAHVQADTPLQITDLLKMTPTPAPPSMYEFHLEQQKDTRVKELYDYVASGIVPNDEQQAKRYVGRLYILLCR